MLGLSVSLLMGCGAENAEAAAAKENAETIQVYLWTTNLYDTYAPYIQSQLPDVNIEFVVGHPGAGGAAGCWGAGKSAPEGFPGQG